jgi:hypothetical protein
MGVVFNAEILTLGDETVVEKGFLFGKYERMNMASSEIVSMEGTDKTAQYRMEVPMSSMPQSKTIYVRAYVKTANITILGNVVSFNKP